MLLIDLLIAASSLMYRYRGIQPKGNGLIALLIGVEFVAVMAGQYHIAAWCSMAATVVLVVLIVAMCHWRLQRRR
ncbi:MULTISPECIES: hypothetical protein [Cupriavidus]